MDEKARTRENDAFWASLVAGEVTEAQATARRLIDIAHPVSAFFNDATETEGAEGEPPGDHVAPDTLSHTVGAWNGDVEVSFVVLSGKECCLARIGERGRTSNFDFVACILPSRGPESCVKFNHSDLKNLFGLSIALGTSHVAIRTRKGSSTADPSIFCGPMLNIQELPPTPQAEVVLD